MRKEKNKNGKNLYERIDDTIMFGVNKGVRLWNSVTGMTKTDLANTMIATSAIAEMAGATIDNLFLLPSAIPICVISHKLMKHNRHIEKLEEEAFEKGAMSSRAESYKEEYKNLGFAMGAVGVVMGGPFYKENASSTLFFGGYGFLLVPSLYVMRADHVPRGKSCLENVLNMAPARMLRRELAGATAHNKSGHI